MLEVVLSYQALKGKGHPTGIEKSKVSPHQGLQVAHSSSVVFLFGNLTSEKQLKRTSSSQFSLKTNLHVLRSSRQYVIGIGTRAMPFPCT